MAVIKLTNNQRNTLYKYAKYLLSKNNHAETPLPSIVNHILDILLEGEYNTDDIIEADLTGDLFTTEYTIPEFLNYIETICQYHLTELWREQKIW